MSTLILLTIRAPHPLTDELILAGYRVLEALAISEVLALVEEHPEAQIIIAADVHDERARVIRQHYPTIQLGPEATASELVFALYPHKGRTLH